MSDSRETECGFLLLTPTGGRRVGFLIEVAFGLTNFLPREVGFLIEVAFRWEDFMDSNLVDSASSHTLVSKIKPCMSKYKSFTLKLRTAHYISYNLFDSPLLLG